MSGCCETGMDRSPAWGPLNDAEHVSLCEALDRVLNTGVVLAGDVVISVADIDLVYLGLQLVLTSVETARQAGLAGDAAARRDRGA